MISSVRWLVDQFPPSTEDEDIEVQFRDRCEDARARGVDIEPEKEAQIVSDALRLHRENRRVHDFQAWALRD